LHAGAGPVSWGQNYSKENGFGVMRRSHNFSGSRCVKAGNNGTRFRRYYRCHAAR
jgi:hypothetical protein